MTEVVIIVTIALAFGVVPATWEAIKNHFAEEESTDWRDEL